MGLTDFADIGFQFASTFYTVWDTLNSPLTPWLRTLPLPGTILNVVLNILAGILDLLSPNVTGLEFILYLCGAGFVIYFVVTLIKWGTDILN